MKNVIIIIAYSVLGAFAQNKLVDTRFGKAVSRKMSNGETRVRFFEEVNVPDTKRVVNMKNSYDPKKVDWASVVSACKATCRFDKRLCNFYIRGAAHDAFAVSGEYGGADGSLVLTEDELHRQENNYDSFAIRLSKNYLAIAQKFGASVADVIAVCGAVAVHFTGGPKILKHDGNQPFMVGRYDNDQEPNPRTLAKAKLNTEEFVNFANQRGLTVEEMTALMGSHSLLDEKACLTTDNKLCNPDREPCDNLEMYRWSAAYYNDTCEYKTLIYEQATEVKKRTTRSTDRKAEKCRFTSKMFRGEVMGEFHAETPAERELTEYIHVDHFPKKFGVPRWPYTVHDAWMGKACQGITGDKSVHSAMNLFKNNGFRWNRIFMTAYKKMININANWVGGKGFPIVGEECPSGYVSYRVSVSCKNCDIKPNYNANSTLPTCDRTCKCGTRLADDAKFYETVM